MEGIRKIISILTLIVLSSMLLNILFYNFIRSHVSAEIFTMYPSHWNKTLTWSNDKSVQVYSKMTGLLHNTTITTVHEPPGIITLFTSMRDSSKRLERNKNTLLNWDALYPAVRPVLFVPQNATNNSLADLVRNITKHWKVLETPYWKSGRPVLKGMFKVLEEVGYNTSYIGFSNGDILFGTSLTQTLLGVTERTNKATSGYLMITGRRRNVIMQRIPSSVCLDCLDKLGRNAALFAVNAEDYFIFTKQGFPWHKCPSHVIGDAFYDNWLVGAAVMWPNITVIDASLTINAIHQTGRDGNFSGNTGKNINRKLTPDKRQANMFIGHGRTIDIYTKTWSYIKKTCPTRYKCIPVHVDILSGYDEAIKHGATPTKSRTGKSSIRKYISNPSTMETKANIKQKPYPSTESFLQTVQDSNHQTNANSSRI